MTWSPGFWRTHYVHRWHRLSSKELQRIVARAEANGDFRLALRAREEQQFRTQIVLAMIDGRWREEA